MKIGSNIGSKHQNCFITQADIRALISKLLRCGWVSRDSIIDKKLPDDCIL